MSTSASMSSPDGIVGGPPSNYAVRIGTGDGLSTDYIQDSSEGTGSTKDRYLVLESATSSYCGPIAAHNLLTHFGNALNYSAMATVVGYSGGETPWSSAYWNGLNSQQSQYSYSGFWEGAASGQNP